MEDNRIIDFCKFISETNRRAFQARKQHEWKIIFSVLALFILSASLKLKHEFQLPTTWLSYFAYGLVALLTIIFLKFVHTANNTNKCIAQRAEGAIQTLINGKDIGQLDLFSVGKRLFPWGSLIHPGQGGLWDWFCKSVIIGVVGLVSGIILAH
jgi:hypothetical protein